MDEFAYEKNEISTPFILIQSIDGIPSLLNSMNPKAMKVNLNYMHYLSIYFIFFFFEKKERKKRSL